MPVRFRKISVDPAVQSALNAAIEATGFTLDDFTATQGTPTVVRARDGIFVALSNAGFTNIEVGGLLGRDPSSVSLGVKRAKKLRKIDPEYDRYIGELGRAIG